MKTINLLTIAFISLATIWGCKSSKDISKVDKMTEIGIPLSGKDYETNKDYFRAKQVGESPDLATAKKIAEQNAKSEMAGNIQSLIKRVTDQYTNQRSVADSKEWENIFEELSREIVNQELIDVKIVGEKLFQKDDNTYQYWIVLEVLKETLLNGLAEGVSNDKKLQLDFDKFQFEKIFNEEMEKFEKERGN
jgi:predicted NAD-dependent protein-ADP-ribosyltransferase YbiA (DUF1768 family)